MKVQPYLFFNGHCDKALAYYKKTLGAEVLQLMRFKDNPGKPSPDKVSPALDDKVMHALMRIGATEVMVSDGMSAGDPEFRGFALTLAVTSVAEANRLFKALSRGGEVKMPIGKTFFSPCFGMVVDRFGVLWMVITAADTAGTRGKARTRVRARKGAK